MRDILLVEDDKDIQEVNKSMLEWRGGYQVRLAGCLAEAKEQVKEAVPDLIVLDVTLPDGNGLDFLAELRQDKNVPVLLLSALGKIEDRIKGLQLGGDDYLSKPYNNDELFARIEALLRRAEQVPETIVKGTLTLRINSNQAFVNGRDIGLGQNIEFSLLHIFVQQENKILSSEYLYEEVWGQPMAGNDKALRTAISEVRKKLEGSGYTITTLRGQGYRFETA